MILWKITINCSNWICLCVTKEVVDLYPGNVFKSSISKGNNLFLLKVRLLEKFIEIEKQNNKIKKIELVRFTIISFNYFRVELILINAFMGVRNNSQYK